MGEFRRLRLGASALVILALLVVACSRMAVSRPTARWTPAGLAGGAAATSTAPQPFAGPTATPHPAWPTATPTATSWPAELIATPMATSWPVEPTATPTVTSQPAEPTATAATDAVVTSPTPAPAGGPAILPFRLVRAVAWSPTGEVLAAADGAAIHLWDPRRGEQLRVIDESAGVRCLAFHPEGRILAAGTLSNTVELWDVEAGLLVRVLEGPNRPVPESAFHPASSILTDLAFGPDGGTLAASVQGYYSGGQGSVWLWQVDTGEPLGILSTYGEAQRVAFGPNGAIMAATWAQTCARGGGGVVMWPGGMSGAERVLTDNGNSMIDLALQPDGRLVAGVGGHGSRCIGPVVVHVWEVESGARIHVLLGAAEASAVAFSPDGTQLASGHDDGTIRLWDAATGERQQTLAGQGGPVLGLAYQPDGRALASWSADGMARLWEWP